LFTLNGVDFPTTAPRAWQILLALCWETPKNLSDRNPSGCSAALEKWHPVWPTNRPGFLSNFQNWLLLHVLQEKQGLFGQLHEKRGSAISGGS
jgi:hypothetical protein